MPTVLVIPTRVTQHTGTTSSTSSTSITILIEDTTKGTTLDSLFPFLVEPLAKNQQPFMG